MLGGWRPDSTHPDFDVSKFPAFADHEQKLQSAPRPASAGMGVEIDGVLDLRPWCSPIKDQGQLGSCVGNGTAEALEFLQARNGLAEVDLSRLFIYYNARLMTQDQSTDGGCFIHLAFGTLASIGTCPESDWPYEPSQVFVRPGWDAYRSAFANKLDNFYTISGSGSTRVDFVKRALRAQHVVVFGMTVDQNYMDYRGPGPVALPGAVRTNTGGHCQVIVGYDDNLQCWIVRNSWGTGWGISGYALVPYAYVEASEANDFWVPALEGTSTDNG